MLEECQDIDPFLTLTQDTDNLHDECSYPYLTLLGKICSSVKGNLKTNETTIPPNFSPKSTGSSHHECSFDIKLYPYSSLLQSLVYEANLKVFSGYGKEERGRSCNRLNHIMRSLSYPLETAASSSKRSKEADSSSDFYDMTYATKLKHIVCQTAVERVDSSHMHHQTVCESPFLLKNVYPLEVEDGNNTIYSEKLREICFEIRNKNNFGSCAVPPLQSHGRNTPHININLETEPLQSTNCDCQLQIHFTKKKECNASCIHKIVNQKHSTQNNISRSKEKSSNVEAGISDEKYLFEAIMKNVEAYSMMNHSYEINGTTDNAGSYQNKLEDSSPGLLEGAGIKIIQKKLANHLNYLPKT